MTKLRKTLCAVPLATALILGTAADKATEKKVEQIMERMKKPEKALKRLEKNKLFTNAEFTRNVKLLAVEVGKLARIRHKEKDFNNISKETVDHYRKLLDSVNKKDYKKIKANWSAVKKSCYECHDLYK